MISGVNDNVKPLHQYCSSFESKENEHSRVPSLVSKERDKGREVEGTVEVLSLFYASNN